MATIDGGEEVREVVDIVIDYASVAGGIVESVQSGDFGLVLDGELASNGESQSFTLRSG